jgi:hypothetical protein
MFKKATLFSGIFIFSFIRGGFILGSHQKAGASGTDFSFPWEEGQFWTWSDRGSGYDTWHGGHNLECDDQPSSAATCAIDFLAPSGSDRKIYSMADGKIVDVERCQNGSANITIDHDGKLIKYMHFDKTKFSDFITTNDPSPTNHVNVSKSQYLGELKVGDFGPPDPNCGNADQTNAHIHLIIPTNRFIMDGWTFDHPNTYATKPGEANKNHGSLFESKNTAQNQGAQEIILTTVYSGKFNNDDLDDIMFRGKCARPAPENEDMCWKVLLKQSGNYEFNAGANEISGDSMYGWGSFEQFDPVVGDFNGDTYSDIMYVGKCAGSNPSIGIRCWRGVISNSSGGWTVKNFGSGVMHDWGSAEIFNPLAGDFNDDGYDDIVYRAECIGNASEECWIIHFSDGSELAEAVNYGDDGMWGFNGSGIEHFDPIVGDYNGDGKDDVAYRGRKSITAPPGWHASWRVHLSTGTELALQIYDGSMYGWTSYPDEQFDPISGDFNNDGYDDLIYVGKCGASVKCMRLHRGTSSNNFSTTGHGTDGNGYTSLWGWGWTLNADKKFNPVSGDYNNDGYADFFYIGYCGSPAYSCLRIHINTGAGFSKEYAGVNSFWGYGETGQ